MLIDVDNHSEPNGTQTADRSQSPHTTPPSNAVTNRERSDTTLSTVSSVPGPQGQPRMSSMFFVVQALESIQLSREGKRNGHLRDAIAKALGMSHYLKSLMERFNKNTISGISSTGGNL